jgi:hypothetical protein
MAASRRNACCQSSNISVKPGHSFKTPNYAWIMGVMTLRLVVPITPCSELQLRCWSTMVMCGLVGIMADLSKLYGVSWWEREGLCIMGTYENNEVCMHYAPLQITATVIYPHRRLRRVWMLSPAL